MSAPLDAASNVGLYIGVPRDPMYYKNKDLPNEEEDFEFVALDEQRIPSTIWKGVRYSGLGQYCYERSNWRILCHCQCHRLE